MSTVTDDIIFKGLTNMQKALYLLLKSRLEDSPYLMHRISNGEDVWISKGYRPLWYFTQRGCGTAAYQRIWQLEKEHDVPLGRVTRHWELWDDGKTIKKQTPCYRIDLTPDEIRMYHELIGFDEAFVKPFRWKFTVDWKPEIGSESDPVQYNLFGDKDGRQ